MSGRMTAGLLLVGTGILLLLDQFGYLDAGGIIEDWWPLALIVIGVGQWMQSRRHLLSGSIFVAAGVLLLLSNLYGLSFWSTAWPLAIIGVGVWLIVKRELAPAMDGADTVDVTAIFAGNDTASTSQNFKGGRLTALFGGINLRLHQARLSPNGATLSATVLFGGVEIRVPKHWRVTTSGFPLFGGFDNATAVESQGMESQPVEIHAVESGTAGSVPQLTVAATVLFGGIEINNKP